MMAILSAIGAVIGGLLSPILNFFNSKDQVTLQGFTAASASDLAAYQALVAAQAQANQAKVANNTSAVAHVMIYLFGLPAALHWAAVFLVSTFPSLGWVVPALPASYASAEREIAMSFFILAPAMPVASAVAAWLQRR